ncbi:hypothetical protein ACLX1H_000152 [Fusarium chlamydosporum]
MANSASNAAIGLLKLPTEIHDNVICYLDKASLKSLRTTCSNLKEIVPFSIDRVFISANSLNIKVFLAIADSEIYRHTVSEIIWDDARLSTGPESSVERNRFWYSGDADDIVTDNGCPLWFKARREDSEEPGWDNRGGPKINSLDLEMSWDYYKDLLKDQRQILESNADIVAFKHGLRRFLNLKRVTVTPSTHGRIGTPMYRTPMIRAFPARFDYPLPKEWPHFANDNMENDEYPWVTDDTIPVGDNECYWMYKCSPEEYRAKWRGFRVVLRALVECAQDHNVTEFRVGGNEVLTGINCRLFDQRSQEYDDLVTLLQRPGFRRVDLDLFTGFIENHNISWVSFRSGLLREALAQAKNLRHVTLRTTTDIAEGEAGQIYGGDLPEKTFPLRTIFPIDQWPNLQHFGISNMLVTQRDLIPFLAALPKSLRSVELSHLAWADTDDDYQGLLESIRTKLDWCMRPAGQRPKVHMKVSPLGICLDQGRYVEIDDMVHFFLYEDGENPFKNGGDGINWGDGGVERDFFDPDIA